MRESVGDDPNLTGRLTAPVRDDDGELLFGVRMVVDMGERKHVDHLKDEPLSMVSHESCRPPTGSKPGSG